MSGSGVGCPAQETSRNRATDDVEQRSTVSLILEKGITARYAETERPNSSRNRKQQRRGIFLSTHSTIYFSYVPDGQYCEVADRCLVLVPS